MNEKRDEAGIRCLLLDLDGTLIDTAPDLANALNALRREEGLDPLPYERIRPFASFGTRGLIGLGFGLADPDPDYRRLGKRFIELYEEHLIRESRPFPGVREFLSRLGDRGLGWGVVTNKYLRFARPLVDAMAFDPAPGCVIGGDCAGHAKPHPAPLLLAGERLGLPPEACIYIGDSARDIQAGKAAGMATVAAAYGYIDEREDVDAWGADIVIRSPQELAVLLSHESFAHAG